MGRAPVGPTYGDVANHARQLAPFLAANRDVIAVVQAGMIGAWGEWHSSVHGLERTDSVKRAVLEAVCRMTPAGRYVQVRVPAYKNLLGVASRDYGRVSFHDDFIIIKPHVWDGGLSVGTPAYRQMEAESPWLPMDGELPWGTWERQPRSRQPRGGMAHRRLGNGAAPLPSPLHLAERIHNYKEGKPDDKFSMQYWKETPVLPRLAPRTADAPVRRLFPERRRYARPGATSSSISATTWVIALSCSVSRCRGSGGAAPVTAWSSPW